ncbi:MAG: hypothetical protein ABI056_05425, partial [Caulobacteraceae bacterium]
MPTAQRRRTRWAIAVSALAHAAVLATALLYRPHLTSPVELAAGPSETMIPVMMTPRSHLARAPEARPAAIPLTGAAKATTRALPASTGRQGAEQAEPAPLAAAPSAPKG